MLNITTKTPRLLIWICNGHDNSKIQHNDLPLPAGDGKLNYLQVLSNECKQFYEAPIILAYCGSLLTEGQKEAIKKLPLYITNLFTLDFDQWLLSVQKQDDQLLARIKKQAQIYQDEITGKKDKRDRSIVDMIHLMRFAILYYSNQVKTSLRLLKRSRQCYNKKAEVAIVTDDRLCSERFQLCVFIIYCISLHFLIKDSILQQASDIMIYHDFDITQKTTEKITIDIQDIGVDEPLLFSLHHNPNINSIVLSLMNLMLRDTTSDKSSKKLFPCISLLACRSNNSILKQTLQDICSNNNDTHATFNEAWGKIIQGDTQQEQLLQLNWVLSKGYFNEEKHDTWGKANSQLKYKPLSHALTVVGCATNNPKTQVKEAASAKLNTDDLQKS